VLGRLGCVLCCLLCEKQQKTLCLIAWLEDIAVMLTVSPPAFGNRKFSGEKVNAFLLPSDEQKGKENNSLQPTQTYVSIFGFAAVILI